MQRSRTPRSVAFSQQVEQVLRDVAEDDLARPASKRPEGDKTLAAADIEQRLALNEVRVVEDPLTPLGIRVEALAHGVLRYCGPHRRDPLCPAVLSLLHRPRG
jgi:hypothetical protein